MQPQQQQQLQQQNNVTPQPAASIMANNPRLPAPTTTASQVIEID